jgi:hypothetical protein
MTVPALVCSRTRQASTASKYSKQVPQTSKGTTTAQALSIDIPCGWVGSAPRVSLPLRPPCMRMLMFATGFRDTHYHCACLQCLETLEQPTVYCIVSYMLHAPVKLASSSPPTRSIWCNGDSGRCRNQTSREMSVCFGSSDCQCAPTGATIGALGGSGV